MSEQLKLLQNDMIAAMKSGDKNLKSVLSSIISRAKLLAKNDKNREVTDRDVIQALEKTVKDTNDTKSYAVSLGRDTTDFDFEISVAKKYLPEQMTENELSVIIVQLLESAPEGKAAKGYVMKNLNEKFKGRFSPQVANQILATLS